MNDVDDELPFPTAAGGSSPGGSSGNGRMYVLVSAHCAFVRQSLPCARTHSEAEASDADKRDAVVADAVARPA